MNKTRIVGVFDEENSLLAAVNEVKKEGIEINEIYTPYPMHEVIEAMGKKTRFTTAAFLYGFFGASGVLAFLYYTSVIDWPVNYGGKPTNAFPSFIVVTIILTILTVTIASLFTFSARAAIFPGKVYDQPDERSTDDKFVIVFDKPGVVGNVEKLNAILKEKGALEVYEKELNLKK